MNIIDIHERINAKNGPDAEHVRIGADGDGRPQKWFEFSVSFFIDGGEFPFEIWALDNDSASFISPALFWFRSMLAAMP